jgi:tetratricopeptide (TPR) repeat protein
MQIEAFRREFDSGIFYRYWQNMHMAANYCLVNNMNLEEGLSWAERSINTFFGEANFLTLSTYAGLLEKFNRNHEADSLMQKAYPMANALQLVQYGSSLNKMGNHQKAFEIFTMNYERDPNDNYANLGMVMGYYFLEDRSEALKRAQKAKTTSTNSNWQSYFDSLINDLNAGKEIFQ